MNVEDRASNLGDDAAIRQDLARGAARPETLGGSPDEVPFRFCGYDHGLYFFLTSKLLFLTADDLPAKLCDLAPWSWWRERFPETDGRGIDHAVNWLFRRSHATGLYDPCRVPDLMAGPGPFVETYADDRFIESLADFILPAPVRRLVLVDLDLEPSVVHISGPFPHGLLRRIRSRHRVTDASGAYPIIHCGSAAIGRRVYWIVGKHPHAVFVEVDLSQIIHVLCELAAEARK